MPSAPTEPGWYDDPEGRRRWWSGARWGAHAPWADDGETAASTSERPQAPRPKLDRSLTFDPTAGGRANRQGEEQQRQPQQEPWTVDDWLRAEQAESSLGRPSWSHGLADRRPSARARAASSRRDRSPGKQLTTAYALAVALGLLGAHRYYLGRLGSGIVQMMLSFAGAAAVVVLTDRTASMWLLAVPATALIWWLSDLLRIASMVRAENARRLGR